MMSNLSEYRIRRSGIPSGRLQKISYSEWNGSHLLFFADLPPRVCIHRTIPDFQRLCHQTYIFMSQFGCPGVIDTGHHIFKSVITRIDNHKFSSLNSKTVALMQFRVVLKLFLNIGSVRGYGKQVIIEERKLAISLRVIQFPGLFLIFTD